MKKIVCMMMSLMLICGNISLGYGMTTDKNAEFKSSSVTILTNTIHVGKINLSNSKANEVKYTYHITPIDSGNQATASLRFILVGKEENLDVTTSGTLTKYLDVNGTPYLEGPLEGNITLDGINYSVLVGFMKNLETDKVNVGVNITPEEGDAPPCLFVFGEDVSLNLENETISSSDSEISSEAENKASSALALTNLGSKSGGLKSYSGFTGKAITVKGQLHKNTNRVFVSVNSGRSAVKAYLKDLNVGCTVNTPKIREMTIGLNRVTAQNSYIAGIETFDFDGTNFGTRCSLHPLLADAMSLKGIPTATIDAVLSGLKGTVNHVNYVNDNKVEFTFGTSDKPNFDSTAAAIVFQLDKQSSGSAKDCKYKLYGKMKYSVVINIPASGTSTIYANAEDVSKTVTFSLT